jgi:hypothetical protein
MRTDDLVRALVADHGTRERSIAAHAAMTVPPAFLAAAALFAMTLGPRPDFAAVATEPRFLFKFVVTAVLAAGAAGLALRLAHPAAATRTWWWIFAAAPILLFSAVLFEWNAVPPELRLSKLVGVNWAWCLASIPLLAAPILAAVLAVLRHGAPTRPGLTGAVAGILAGGLGAVLYAAHCPDDSPLFVASWYSLAIAAVAIAGSWIGSKVLRW